MEFQTVLTKNGFKLTVMSGDGRTRYLKWTAKDEGDLTDSGMIDLSMLEVSHSAHIDTGWKPREIVLDQVRDPTPGVHQPLHSIIPPGSCEISFESKIKSSIKLDFYLSPSGHHADGRVIKSIDGFERDARIEFIVPSKESWTKLFIKKTSRCSNMASLSDLRVTHALSGRSFECLSHLIKPEHKGCEKSGKSTIIFKPEAIQYSYFSMSFQKL